MKKWASYLTIVMLLLSILPQTVVYADSSVEFSGGEGTPSNPYQIETPEQLDKVRNYLDKHFILKNDIDLTEYLAEGGAGYNDGKGWAPIGGISTPIDTPTNYFSGSLDGAGYKIKNLKIRLIDSAYIGLFSNIRSGAIKNITLENVDIEGHRYVGALAGSNSFGTIDNVSVSGKVAGPNNDGRTEEKFGGLIGDNYGNITNSNANVTVIGYTNVGGLVGINNGTISTSYATGNVEGISSIGGLVGTVGEGTSTLNTFATGNVRGEAMLGGLIGYGSNANIHNSYAIGQVSPISTRVNYVGGLVGFDNFNNVIASYYDIETTTQGNNEEGQGKTTEEMQKKSTFIDANWDFSNIWDIGSGGYPFLRAISPIKSYSVKYDANGATSGTVPSDGTAYNNGNTILVLENYGHLEKTGYNFTGWNTIADGSGISYIADATFDIGAQSVTLYAQWKINQPIAPLVTINDVDNKLIGADNTMEYSTDSGDNWTSYDSTNSPIFTGNVTVQIRVKADVNMPAGEITELTFSANPIVQTLLNKVNTAKATEDISAMINALSDPELDLNPELDFGSSGDDIQETIAEMVMYMIEGQYENQEQIEYLVNLAFTPMLAYNDPDISSIKRNINEFFIGLQNLMNIFPKETELVGTAQLGEKYVTMSNVDKEIFAYRTKLYILRDPIPEIDYMGSLTATFSVYRPINTIKKQIDMYSVFVHMRLLQKESEEYNATNPLILMEEFPLKLDKKDTLTYQKEREMNQWMIDKRPANGYVSFEEIQETFDLFFTPTAPAVTIEDGNNTLIGADNTMEYSTDDGTTWKNYDSTNSPTFTGNVTVQIRVKADEATPAGEITTLRFTKNAPPAPTVTMDDANNILIGADNTMEYSKDGGDTWTSYAPTNSPTFTGNVTVQIRVKADEETPAGEITTLTFIKNVSAVPNPSPSPSPTPTSPTTEQIVVDVDGEDGTNLTKTPVIRTTDSNGIVKDKVAMTETLAKEIVAKAKQQGVDTARIVIPDTNDKVAEIKVDIPKTALKQLNDGNLKLEIVTDNAVISIPTKSISGFAEDLYFHIVPMKTEQQRKLVEERAKKEEMIQDVAQNQTVQVLGRPMEIETNMQSREVSIILPLKDSLPSDAQKRQEILDNLGVFIEHSDGTKELMQGELVKMKDGSEGIEFMITKFSTFTLVYMDGWKEYQDDQKQVHKAYINGIGGGIFHPNADVTRAQMAKMLAQNLSDVNSNNQPSYMDVSKTHWAYNDILKSKNAGIMLGTSTDKFNPEGTITRAQMAMIGYRWIQQECKKNASSADSCTSLTSFTKANYKDISSNHWALEAIAFMKETNFMNGYDDNTFRADENLTRAQAVKVLNRLFKRGPLTGVETPTFKDVPKTHWAYYEVEEAARAHQFTIDTDGKEAIKQ